MAYRLGSFATAWLVTFTAWTSSAASISIESPSSCDGTSGNSAGSYVWRACSTRPPLMSSRSPSSDSDKLHVGCLEALSRRLNSASGTTHAGSDPSTGICAKSESSPSVACKRRRLSEASRCTHIRMGLGNRVGTTRLARSSSATSAARDSSTAQVWVAVCSAVNMIQLLCDGIAKTGRAGAQRDHPGNAPAHVNRLPFDVGNQPPS